MHWQPVASSFTVKGIYFTAYSIWKSFKRNSFFFFFFMIAKIRWYNHFDKLDKFAKLQVGCRNILYYDKVKLKLRPSEHY